MPLAHIHTIKTAYTPDELRLIADTIYQTMRTYFTAPDEDRYQMISQHEPYELICSDTNLGFTRSERLIFLQVVQQGRSAAVKESYYGVLMAALKDRIGLGEGDLIISVTANTREDWSFGGGKAQFLNGDL
ncbi:hypothetical protein V866_008346 [Kwoniella sp. B9012]